SRWGTGALRSMKETLAYATYQKGHTDAFNLVQRLLARRERAVSGFILGMRLTSAALNRYAGAITLAGRVAATGAGGGATAAKFLARVFNPKPGFARLGVPERQAVYDKLIGDGYLYDRWHRSPYRVFAQLASQRLEVEESERASQNARALKRRDAWQRFQQWALSGMVKGEIGNGIDLYLSLRQAGRSEADAIHAVSRMTRDTQNPSTPLEETGLHTAVRSAGLGWFLPFLGQPTVMWDLVKAEYLKSKASGTWRGFRTAAAGAIVACLFSVALRALVRRVSKGLMDGDDDDERDRDAELANTVLDLTGELSASLMPGADQVIQGLVRPILAWSTGNRSFMPPMATDSTLFGQISVSGDSIGKAIVRAAEGKDFTEEQVEKLVMDIHRLVGMATGLPTGGLEQAARVTAGALGDPLGRKPPGDSGTSRRLVPPPRRPKHGESWGSY
ncbi:MAG: hypothetical protein PHR35_15685, partial [Kiritimatiellae bacterium]|nr:hypothetical protein [Kiritimatiellia bacterium]